MLIRAARSSPEVAAKCAAIGLTIPPEPAQVNGTCSQSKAIEVKSIKVDMTVNKDLPTEQGQNNTYKSDISQKTPDLPKADKVQATPKAGPQYRYNPATKRLEVASWIDTPTPEPAPAPRIPLNMILTPAPGPQNRPPRMW
jgi:hypothetical protein